MAFSWTLGDILSLRALNRHLKPTHRRPPCWGDHAGAERLVVSAGPSSPASSAEGQTREGSCPGAACPPARRHRGHLWIPHVKESPR